MQTGGPANARPTRYATSLIVATLLILFAGFLYVFNRTTFFGEPSVDRTTTGTRP